MQSNAQPNVPIRTNSNPKSSEGVVNSKATPSFKDEQSKGKSETYSFYSKSRKSSSFKNTSSDAKGTLKSSSIKQIKKYKEEITIKTTENDAS